MSKNAFHSWRNFLGPAVVSLIGMFASSLLAQAAGAGALTGTVTELPSALVGNALITAASARPDQANTRTTEIPGPVFNLMPSGNFSERFEIACSESVEILSATVSVSGTVSYTHLPSPRD